MITHQKALECLKESGFEDLLEVSTSPMVRDKFLEKNDEPRQPSNNNLTYFWVMYMGGKSLVNARLVERATEQAPHKKNQAVFA